MTTMPDDALAQWLATGTTRSTEVILYNDQKAVDALNALYDEIDEFESQPTPTQRAIGEKSTADERRLRIEEFERRTAELEDRVAASKAVWKMRALSTDELNKIRAEHPDPPAPRLLPQAAPKAAKEKWEMEAAEFRKKAAEAEKARVFAEIALATISVTTAAGEANAVSVDLLEAMYNAPYGDFRIATLAKAVKDLSAAEIAPTVPKSPSSSDDDQA